MPIKYRIEPNSLTSPPAYKAFPLPSVIHDYDSLSEQINLHNPTIPAQTAKSVLEAFRAETKLQLASGNTINLEGFISMVVSLPGKIDLPTDTFPLEDVTIKAKASVVLRDEIRQDAEFQQEDYVEKAPSILTVVDTNTEIQNYARDDYGLSIVGSNIGFDPLDAEQGVFLVNGAGTRIKQTRISLNNPSLVIITPELPAFSPTQNNVQMLLYATTRYTENGQLRSGAYSKQVRGTNVVEDGFTYIFSTNAEVSSPVIVSSYLGAQVDCQIVARIRPVDNVMLFSVGTLEGVFGPAVEVSVATEFVVLTGLAADVTLTMLGYTAFHDTLVAHGRYLQEVIDLSPVSP